MDSIHPIEPPKTSFFARFKKSISGQPKEYYLICGVAIFLLLALLILAVILSFKNTSRAASGSLTPTPTAKPKPSKTPTPTKKVSLTPTITPKTPSPTITPTITPTNTPQPTNTPIPLNTPTPTPLPPDTTPPVITSMTGPADGSTVDFNGFCFPMTISDNKPGNQNFLTQHTFDSATWTDWEANYAPCFNNVSNGSHTFTVHAKDEAGNISATITRTFTVQQ